MGEDRFSIGCCLKQGNCGFGLMETAKLTVEMRGQTGELE